MGRTLFFPVFLLLADGLKIQTIVEFDGNIRLKRGYDNNDNAKVIKRMMIIMKMMTQTKITQTRIKRRRGYGQRKFFNLL